MSSISRFISLLCCFAVLLCASLMSQAQDAPQRVIVEKYAVKSGTNDKFEEVIKKFKEAVKKTNAPYRWLVSQSFVGGGNSYNIVIPFSSWGTFANEQDVLKEAYSKREVDRINGLMEESVVKMKSAVYTMNMDASRPLPAGTPEVAVELLFITPKQGMEQQLQQFAVKVKEATVATEPAAYFEFFNGGIGANGALVVLPVQAWTDLDRQIKPIPQRLSEHFGEKEGAKIMEMAGASVANIKSTLHVVRADLANPPEQQ